MRRKTDAEKLDALNRQYKQKNKYIAANYDRIGIVTPKGTRDYIKSLGMSANSYINGLIEADRRRREAAEDPEQNLQEPAADHQQAKPQEATTSAGAAEGSLQEDRRTRGRSRKASGANRSHQETTGGSETASPAGETTGGPEEGTTAGSPETARRETPQDLPGPEPVDAARDPEQIARPE